MLGSAEWAELYNEAYGSQYYSPEDIEKYRTNADPDLYPNVDWFDALFDDMAANQRVNLNITGGSDIVKYYVSGAFIMKAPFIRMQATFMATIRPSATTNSILEPMSI